MVVITETLSHKPPEPAQHEIIVSDVMSVGGAFASFGFAYGCHPVLPDVIASMKKPWQVGRPNPNPHSNPQPNIHPNHVAGGPPQPQPSL